MHHRWAWTSFRLPPANRVHDVDEAPIGPVLPKWLYGRIRVETQRQPVRRGHRDPGRLRRDGAPPLPAGGIAASSADAAVPRSRERLRRRVGRRGRTTRSHGCGAPPRETAWLNLRGQIRQVDLDPVRGSVANKHRPAVIVSDDRANATATRLGRESSPSSRSPATPTGSIRPTSHWTPRSAARTSTRRHRSSRCDPCRRSVRCTASTGSHPQNSPGSTTRPGLHLAL